ncbi:MAG: hypothetical protein ACRDRP_19640 [Pseudonocardiaceae bacterium]
MIVFTHNDRLADAVRWRAEPETVWEVVRRDHSHVELRRCAGGRMFASAARR